MPKGDGSALDPVTVEVVRHRLDGIANEMESTLFRSAFSPLVKEALDASASLFTLEGETLAQAIAIPNHLTTLIPMVGRIIEAFPVATMREGDAYVLNDPYHGGTHMPDIAVVMPIFHEGRPVAISATLTHHQDVGGMTPGSIPTDATEIFQEGFRIPAMKLCEGGRYDETLIAMLRLNVRMPDELMGDLNAQIAACVIGVRRMRDLAAQHGVERLRAIFAELLERSETLTRQLLASLKQGTYRYSDVIDNDGIDVDRRIPISVAVTLKDGGVTVDFTGSSDQVRGPFNCPPSAAYAAACFAVRAVGDADIPNNGGCFRPLSLVLPEGSIVNPSEPAPVGCRAATAKRLTTAILGALRQAAPLRVPADSASELAVLVFGGRRAEGRRFVAAQLLVSGTGASHRSDGVDVIETDLTNSMNVPVEALEAETPLRVERFALVPDSGGAGRWRGGLGCSQVFQVLEGEIVFTYRGERHFTPAKGAEGGHAGAPAAGVVVRAGGGVEALPSKKVATVRGGDRIEITTAGGGGYGDPRSRPAALVAADLRNGKVGRESAAGVYGYRGEAAA